MTYLGFKPHGLPVLQAFISVIHDETAHTTKARADCFLAVIDTAFGHKLGMNLALRPLGQFQVVKQLVIVVHVLYCAQLLAPASDWLTSADDALFKQRCFGE
jgi:hypothetical protein